LRFGLVVEEPVGSAERPHKDVEMAVVGIHFIQAAQHSRLDITDVGCALCLQSLDPRAGRLLLFLLLLFLCFPSTLAAVALRVM
jgi:hypothetical protein